MGKLIAVAGKGGTGKTTVAALVIRHLLRTRRTPVLAVDADPNDTLGEALGIEVQQTIGALREEFIGERAQIPAGMSKDAVLEAKMHATLHESKGMDLLVMGRQEGPGCYCALNNLLRNFLDQLAADYPFVVVDNEAGMEHLSRRNTRKVDLMLVVSDHTIKAARAAGRIVALAEELGLSLGQRFLVLNRSPAELAVEVQNEIDRYELPLLAILPEDADIRQNDVAGRPLVLLPDETPSIRALTDPLDRILGSLRPA